MRFSEIYKAKKQVVSFELFPPRTPAGLADTFAMMSELAKVAPDFMTVTYGAGGGTRSQSIDMVRYIVETLKLTAVQHLVCGGHSCAEIDDLVSTLVDRGIRNVLALRGDPPKGKNEFSAHPDGYTCARDLVRRLKVRGDISIAVAGYPETHREAKSKQADLDYLKEKVDAGAEIVITQLFFDPDFYHRFVDDVRAAGITVPIVPGIMPIGNVAQIERFTSLCGASIPEKLRADLAHFQEKPEDVTKFGIDYAASLARALLSGGAPGVHLYTLNKTTQVIPIVQALGLNRTS